MQSFGRGWNLAPTTANAPIFKVSSTFSKVVESKGKAFGRPAHRAKFFLCKKAQEGRQNSPADCFVVGNPRRGFPGACQRAVNSRRQCTQGESSFARYPLRCNCNHSGEGRNLAPTKCHSYYAIRRDSPCACPAKNSAV